MSADGGRDAAGTAVPPPILYVGAMILGVILNFFFAITFLPAVLAWTMGPLFVVVGIVLIVSAFRALIRGNTPLDPSLPTASVVKEGVYRFTRNPIYLSFTLICLGVSFTFNLVWALALLVAVFIAIDRGQIRREEKYLERKFGEEYLRYKERVRRWF